MSIQTYTVEEGASGFDILNVMAVVLQDNPSGDTRVKLVVRGANMLCERTYERSLHEDRVTVWEVVDTLLRMLSYEEQVARL